MSRPFCGSHERYCVKVCCKRNSNPGSANKLKEASSGVKSSLIMEEALLKSNDDLEKRVQLRTLELAEAHKKLEDEIEQRKKFELRLRSVVETAPDGIISIDSQGKIILWNKGAERIFGYTANEVYGKNVSLVAPPRYLRALNQLMYNLSSTGKLSHEGETLEFSALRKDGSEFPVALTTAKWETREEVFFTGIIRDITEIRKITSELNKSHKQLRNLAAHLQSVREEERMKIAREIDDELGQTLTAHKMELSWFRETYGDHKPIFDKAGSMLNTLNETIRSVRRICTDLWPSILDDFGLVDAMQWQADEFKKRTQIECVVEAEPEYIELDNELSTALFRIFQETLTNVLKHAKATKVTARLTLDNGNIILEVTDNGKGIENKHLSKPQSFGLLGMRERVYPWGGKVRVTGSKNKGTKVNITMPYGTAKSAQPKTSAE